MSYKKGTNMMLLLITLLASTFLFQSFSIKALTSNQPIGPDFFPKIISILLIISCLISYISTRKRTEGKKVELENFKFVIYTILATILFVSLWQLLGMFYLCSFLLMLVLLFLFNNNPNFWKRTLISVGVSLLVTLFIYVVFGQLLNVMF